MLCRRTKEAKMPAQGFSIRNLLFGFIAGAIAVVVVHQSVVYALVATGMLPATSIPWNWKPYGPLGVPTVVNTMFWGGLWGALFGVIWDKLPGGAMWLRGLIYGLIIVVVSNWTLLPLIRAHVFGVTNAAQIALFSGGDPKRMLNTVLIQMGFGIGLAIIFSVIAKAR